MSNTVKLTHCPKCNLPIPAEAPQGLCPKCVLRAAATETKGGHSATGTQEIPSLSRIAAAFPQLEIVELIGRGGMGFVFKARQPHLDRFVALKLLPDKLARDVQFAERFNREGRVLARLNHPNIVSVYDFGQTGGFYYLLMEYIDGVNLRQAMQAGRFSPAEALSIVPRICEALQYAHEQGILHRDIKPENILLDGRGRVKIADFGIAKLVGEDQPNVTLTNTGAALGTPHYMAPEQLEKPAEVDHRADIYSLGVVLYEMLTGELPIGRFAPPSAKTPVNPTVDEVVFRTLEKDRERRFQSAGEMKTHIEDLGAGASHPPVLPDADGADASEKSRVSRWAIYGAMSVGLSLPGPLSIVVSILAGRGGIGWAELGIALGSVAMLGLGGTLMGWLGLNEIRENGGQVRGLPLAIFATLTWPLLAVCVPTIGLPFLITVEANSSSVMKIAGRLLMMLVPAAVIAFALWSVHATARWGSRQPTTERRGILKWVFIGVLVVGMGIVLVTQSGSNSKNRPTAVVHGAAYSEPATNPALAANPNPAEIQQTFRVTKGQVVTFQAYRQNGENREPIRNFAGYVFAPDDERGRFTLSLVPSSIHDNQPRDWRLRLVSDDGATVTGAPASLGELLPISTRDQLRDIAPDRTAGISLTRSLMPGESGPSNATNVTEISFEVVCAARQLKSPVEATVVSVGTTNWVSSSRQRTAAKPQPQVQPGEVLASQWLQSPNDTNSPNRIRFMFTDVSVVVVGTQRWLAMDFDLDVTGDCEEVFRVDAQGFQAVTRKVSMQATPKDAAPVKRQRIEWLVPAAVDEATLASFSQSVRDILVAKSFVIPAGEQRPLFRLPVANLGDLSVGIGAKIPALAEVRRLEGRLAFLYERVHELLSKFTPEHPVIQSLRKQIADVQAEIKAATPADTGEARKP